MHFQCIYKFNHNFDYKYFWEWFFPNYFVVLETFSLFEEPDLKISPYFSSYKQKTEKLVIYDIFTL